MHRETDGPRVKLQKKIVCSKLFHNLTQIVKKTTTPEDL